MTTFSPAPKPHPTVKPPKGMKAVNKARKKLDDVRVYGSLARRKWIRLQPCSCCGVWGYSEGAHVLGGEGAGMKKSYKTIAALCGPRLEGSMVYEGCHRFSHRDPAAWRARFPAYNPRKAAVQTERKWKRFLAGESVGLPSTEHES